MKIIALVLVSLLVNSFILNAQIVVQKEKTSEGVYLPSIPILYDNNDAIAVKNSLSLFANDVLSVTGKKPNLHNNLIASQNMMIAGTVDSKWIQLLTKNGKINIDSIRGQWERFGIYIVDHPFPNVKKALVVAGSDRRGLSYGLFSISEVLGVSPWYWWADVPIRKNNNASVLVKNFISSSPTVKFRGLFINDEDWGILPWAKKTYDTTLKDIGPKTYKKVFELLLRLKANYLCPAMHEASGAFNKYPENKRLADSFGIVMGSTHPEPLLFNNASEWDKQKMGDWNYSTNRNNIVAALDKRVSENSQYENVYTLALRGLHDKEMTGEHTLKERLTLVNQAIKDQRFILKKYIKKPIEEIPQIFVPYKEVLQLYNEGLDIPDDVTIVWPDDNYGYMKRLSNEEERNRKGGSGVYYHASYLGIPHDYLWISSTTPNLMYEELSKAYNTGANKVWLLNAGDIKSCEQPISLFLQMAYAINDFNYENTPLFPADWLAKQFGQKYYSEFLQITQLYSSLAFVRKPEHMGWGLEWNANKYPRERITDTEFSFDNYDEADNRFNQYTILGNKVSTLYKKLPESIKPSFFQLVYYPCKGAEYMNKKWLYAQQSRIYHNQQRSSTNEIRQKSLAYQDSLIQITKAYNSLLNGKWNHIMSLKQGVTASYFESPILDSIILPEQGSLQIKTENATSDNYGQQYILPSFNKYRKHTIYFDLYNTGREALDYTLSTDQNYIRLSSTKGKVDKEQRIYVDIDWDKIKTKTSAQGTITVESNKQVQNIYTFITDNNNYAFDSIKNLALEIDGYVSIPAANYNSKNENDKVKITQINHLGIEGSSILLGDAVGTINDPRRSDAANVEYSFYTTGRGMVDVYTYVLPTFPLSNNQNVSFHEFNTTQTRYGVTIDNGAVSYPSTSSQEYTQNWADNVIRNATINKSVLYINKPGLHTIKIIAGDPGLIVQKIVIDMGGMKKSYVGPPSTVIGK